MDVKKIQEIEKKLKRMKKSQIEEIYCKTLYRYSKGSKKR